MIDILKSLFTYTNFFIEVPYLGQVDVAKAGLALVVFISLSVMFRILQKVIIHRLQHLSTRTTTDIDDMLIGAIKSIRPVTYSLLAFYVALLPYSFPVFINNSFQFLVYFVLTWQVIEVATKLIEYVVGRVLARDEDGDGVNDPGATTASEMITLMARIVLWVLGGLFVLSNIGIEVGSLIAGLGIGGIAVAFALQGVLSDLFASFSIYFDKPFRIGDFVVIGTDSGTVEKIGIKSTRIRTLQGEELVISNSELTTARVQNFKKMKERRIVTTFGITYETPYAQVESINGIVTRIFADIALARLDRVYFTTLADSALQFEVVYFVNSAEYTDYLSVQQKLNLELLKIFAERGISFAYPTQTIYSQAK